MSDDGPLLTDNTAAVFSELQRERDEALERLGPIDPAGNDRIDELESAIGFLRHDLDVAKRERDEALAERQEIAKVADKRLNEWLKACAETGHMEAERDEAQEACRAWQGVYETLEAHLMDRVAMQDPASPETYLSILRSSVARVERDSERLLNARWARESEAARQVGKMSGEVRHLMEVIDNRNEFIEQVERQRDEAVAQRDYWKKQLLSEQADYDEARKERDAAKEALIRASQRLGDLGANILEPSRRTIAEVVADISQALAGLEEA